MLKYKNQIDALLHAINVAIQKDWTAEPSGAFKEATSINRLAAVAAMSPRNLQLLFQSYMQGENIGSYVTRLRLDRILWLLKNTQLTNREISEQVGICK